MRVREVAQEELVGAIGEDWVDNRRRPYVDGGIAYIPVKEGFSADREIAERRRYNGGGFFMLGDVAVIRGMRPSKKRINELVSFRHPRGVLWIRSFHDHTRIPDAEVMFGDVDEVCHHENGFTYVFDPRSVMFAQGNREEKQRMAGLVKTAEKPERVADMFAGIGYFTIPMAGCGADVHAMEINPVAFRYLQQNIMENRLSDRVQAACGDCRNLLSGIYDRIIMGHFDAITIFGHALRHVRIGSVIHLHSIGMVKHEIQMQVSSAGFSAEIHVHKVKKYRPHTWHMVQDVVFV
ncbi:MAG: methyltransferase [Methanoregula sp.]|jgi:tRNA wybutosine-synthesizing protein 2|nr:methyltransferase [Methanoregula sp.]